MLTPSSVQVHINSEWNAKCKDIRASSNEKPTAEENCSTCYEYADVFSAPCSIYEITIRMQSIRDNDRDTLPWFHSALLVPGKQYVPVLLTQCIFRSVFHPSHTNLH